MKTKLVTIFTLACIILVACGSSATPTPKQASTSIPSTQAPISSTAVSGSKVDITISGFKFDPDTVTVTIGTTVTWTNQDTTAHTVVADDGSWKSDSLAKGANFSFTFDKAGTYTYICSIHPTMKGTVIVK
jgi:plastocyanin